MSDKKNLVILYCITASLIILWNVVSHDIFGIERLLLFWQQKDILGMIWFGVYFSSFILHIAITHVNFYNIKAAFFENAFGETKSENIKFSLEMILLMAVVNTSIFFFLI